MPPQESTLVHQLSDLVAEIALHDGQPLPSGVTARCQDIESYITSEENRFVSDLEQIVQSFSPGYTGWDPFSNDKVQSDQALKLFRDPKMSLYLATGLVLKARMQLGIPHNDPDLKGMAQAILDSSRATIEIYRNILEKLFSTGWNPTKKKRTNSYWDMQIVFSAGEKFDHDSSALHVVTADGGILDAAKTAGLGSSVLSLVDYLLGLHV